jgi:hypothetical protein
LSNAERLAGTDVDALLDCARNGENAINSPKQKTTDLIRVSCLQILARKIFIRNPNPGSFHRAVLLYGQRLCVIHVGRSLIKRCEVSLHCYGIFCLMPTTPTAMTETVFPEVSRSDRPVGIFQLDETRRRLPLEPARVAQDISRLLV